MPHPGARPIPDLHAVILAGGSGTRFWPLSRELAPKQLLATFGGTSLITQAVERVSAECGPDRIHVLTSPRLLTEVRDHLVCQPALDEVCPDVVAEPAARNTAAAIALAAAYVEQRDPGALIAVLPSDHLLEHGPLWRDTLDAAVRLARAGFLTVIGLAPSEPETAYGYIRMGATIPDTDGGGSTCDGTPGGTTATIGYRVARFTEKPDRPTAEEYLAEGGYLWNAGMLVARAADVLGELRSAGSAAATADSSEAHHIAETAEWLAASVPPSAWHTESEALARFAALPSVQFDRAVLEVSERVAVVPSAMRWSDVGSLLALETLADADEHGNTLIGPAVDVDSRGVTTYAQDRLVATLGLEDVLVVDTLDATLVAAKDRAQDVRLVVEALAAAGAPEVVEHRTNVRPWGRWTVLLRVAGYQIKEVHVEPGRRLSLQSHARRSEHWVVVEGRALVELDGRDIELGPNESAYVPVGSRHRLTNIGDEALKVIEVAVGAYLGEDDIERYEDDWDR